MTYKIRVNMTATFLYEDIEAESIEQANELAEERARADYDKYGLDYPTFTVEDSEDIEPE